MTTTFQTFRRASSAATAAGPRPYIKVGCGRDAIYIVGDFDPMDSIELISPPQPPKGSQPRPVRHMTAQVTLRHFERLGNANHAAGDPRWIASARAFPFSTPGHEPSLVELAEAWKIYDRKRAAEVAAEHCATTTGEA